MRRTSLLLLSLALPVVSSVAGGPAAGQAPSPALPFDSVSLRDLSAFRSPGASWRVAGEARADRGRRLHLAVEPGTGVLVNLPGGGRGSNLFTGWEHGDLELELEVLMPKGSNSGLYLQGRYELQLIDSWGEPRPTHGDAGGIYQRWDESRPEGEKGYEGHPPRVNASRAPGLWEHFRIVFRAPRFDAQGRKTANARFVRVVHNGVVIHENVEVTGPTRGPAFDDERPTGPLMIQGDHGPVAFRNIRYKRHSGERLRLSELRYRAFDGQFRTLEEGMAGAPARAGEADAVASAVAGVEDRFAVAFDGTVSVPAAGRYLFELGLDWVEPDPHREGPPVGGGRLSIGGREVVRHDGEQPVAHAEVHLEAGRHPFSFAFFKNRPWTDRSNATLWVEGPGIERHALHDTGSTSYQPAGAITVEPGGEPVVLRGFVTHDGAVRTHAVSVGDPAGVHYAYDLARGALLHAWRGPFLEATDMWHSRGERQLARALGSRLDLSGAPAVAALQSESQPWPDHPGAESYRFRGYTLDGAGRPSFRYRTGEVEVEERIRPTADGTSLHRELELRAPDGTRGVYARIARGAHIRRLSDGSYLVDDSRYYVALERRAPTPVVRRQDDLEELLLPIRFRRGAARLAYTIIW